MRREQRAAGIETKQERRRRVQLEAYEAEQRRSELEKSRRALLSAEQRRHEDERLGRDLRRVVGMVAMLR